MKKINLSPLLGGYLRYIILILSYIVMFALFIFIFIFGFFTPRTAPVIQGYHILFFLTSFFYSHLHNNFAPSLDNRVFFYQIKRIHLFRFRIRFVILYQFSIFLLFILYLAIYQLIFSHNNVELIIKSSLIVLLIPFFSSLSFISLPAYTTSLPPFKNIFISATFFLFPLLLIQHLPLTQVYTSLGYYSYLIALFIIALSCSSLIFTNKHLKRSCF